MHLSLSLSFSLSLLLLFLQLQILKTNPANPPPPSSTAVSDSLFGCSSLSFCCCILAIFVFVFHFVVCISALTTVCELKCTYVRFLLDGSKKATTKLQTPANFRVSIRLVIMVAKIRVFLFVFFFLLFFENSMFWDFLVVVVVIKQIFHSTTTTKHATKRRVSILSALLLNAAALNVTHFSAFCVPMSFSNFKFFWLQRAKNVCCCKTNQTKKDATRKANSHCILIVRVLVQNAF